MSIFNCSSSKENASHKGRYPAKKVSTLNSEGNFDRKESSLSPLIPKNTKEENNKDFVEASKIKRDHEIDNAYDFNSEYLESIKFLKDVVALESIFKINTRIDNHSNYFNSQYQNNYNKMTKKEIVFSENSKSADVELGNQNQDQVFTETYNKNHSQKLQQTKSSIKPISFEDKPYEFGECMKNMEIMSLLKKEKSRQQPPPFLTSQESSFSKVDEGEQIKNENEFFHSEMLNDSKLSQPSMPPKVIEDIKERGFISDGFPGNVLGMPISQVGSNIKKGGGKNSTIKDHTIDFSHEKPEKWVASSELNNFKEMRQVSGTHPGSQIKYSNNILQDQKMKSQLNTMSAVGSTLSPKSNRIFDSNYIRIDNQGSSRNVTPPIESNLHQFPEYRNDEDFSGNQTDRSMKGSQNSYNILNKQRALSPADNSNLISSKKIQDSAFRLGTLTNLYPAEQIRSLSRSKHGSGRIPESAKNKEKKKNASTIHFKVDTNLEKFKKVDKNREKNLSNLWQQNQYHQPPTGHNLGEENRYANLEQSRYANPEQSHYANPEHSRYANPEQSHYANLEQSRYINPEQSRYANPEQNRYANPEKSRYVNPVQNSGNPGQIRYGNPEQTGYSNSEQEGYSNPGKIQHNYSKANTQEKKISANYNLNDTPNYPNSTTSVMHQYKDSRTMKGSETSRSKSPNRQRESDCEIIRNMLKKK